MPTYGTSQVFSDGQQHFFLGLNREGEWQLESDRLNSKWSLQHLDWVLFTTQETRSNKRLVYTTLYGHLGN